MNQIQNEKQEIKNENKNDNFDEKKKNQSVKTIINRRRFTLNS